MNNTSFEQVLLQFVPKNSPVILEPNYQAYNIYAELLNTGTMLVDLSTITKDTIDFHFDAILAILHDGIETDQVQSMKLYATYADGYTVPFSIFDYYINMIFWYLPVACGDPITSEYFIFEKDGFTQQSIKKYIDNLFLERHRSDFTNIWMNNAIDNAIYRFIFIDDFSDYFMNTFNNEDSILLMQLDKDFYDATHLDVSNVPIEDVKKVGEEATDKAINSIINSGFHWAKPYFKSRQGINRKQYRQFQINIGTEPDGNGGVYPAIINSSYSNGGANSTKAMVMEAQVARVAQILQKDNVGSSGQLARLLSINNLDTKIYPDLNYFCNTKNTVKIHIVDEDTLNRLKGRYYKFSKHGIVKRISSNPTSNCRELIGRTIELYSPMTCASYSRDEGYCRQCYGDLAYTNYDINPGKFAAEELSAQLTQRLLSAKHLLESNVIALKWVSEFESIFSVEANIIMLIEDMDYKGFKLIIDIENIECEDDIDSFDYNEYIKVFKVKTPGGGTVEIHTEEYENIYIMPDLSELLAKKKINDKGEYVINLDGLNDIGLFKMQINNIELSKALNSVTATIDKQTVINQLGTKDAVLQELLENVSKSGLDTASVHLEVILSNQIRRADNIIENPENEYDDAPYQMLTLKSALTNHPSIAIALEYGKVGKPLRSPLTYKKTKPSVADLFYMTRPQNYTSSKPQPAVRNVDEPIRPFTIKPDPDFCPEGIIDDSDDGE